MNRLISPDQMGDLFKAASDWDTAQASIPLTACVLCRGHTGVP